jgi:hypothetical protein
MMTAVVMMMVIDDTDMLTLPNAPPLQVSIEPPTPSEAVANLLETCSSTDVILVTGSFYVVSVVRAYLARRRPRLFPPDDWVFMGDPPLAPPGVRELWGVLALAGVG